MFALLPLLPLLHAGGPEPIGPPYTHWILAPQEAVYIFGVTALYLLWVGPLNRRRPGHEQRPVTKAQIRWFLLGSFFLLIALGPPLDDWSYHFFSSVHMVQHLMLMFVVMPCWIKGVPAWVYDPLLRHRWSRWVLTTMPKVVPAFLVATLIIGLWHWPAFYNLTLENQFVHALQHQFFMVAGFLFFWPLMSPVPESPQLSAPMKCVYLFLQTIPSGVIGAMITYAGPGLYPHYEKASQRPFGISVATDQQLGGLVMWVGMNAIFLLMITIIFLKWAAEEERKERRPVRRRTSPPVAPEGVITNS